FFEEVSAAARRKLAHHNRLAGTDLWDSVVSAGLRKVFFSTTAPHTEVTPFFTGLDRVVRTSLIPIAERAKVGTRLGREIGLGDSFFAEFDERIKKLDISRDMAQNRRSCFRACCNAVTALCARHAPEDLKHADLLSICAYEILNSAGCLEITVFFELTRRKN
ncbi:MAG TPA: hypothetical protein VKY31_08185, partial [Terriglobia bacterium]|nr:hypothetical protein [Terriglobia bacterium]